MSVIDDQISPLHCLVVDDDKFARELLTTTLKTLGVKQVMSAATGSEAFEMLAKAPRTVDLVLSDVRMPEGNGLQLLHALRTGLIKSMRVNATFVLATASPTTEAVKTASSLDANGFVVKPVMPDKLQAAILKARRTIFPPMPARYSEVSVPAEL